MRSKPGRGGKKIATFGRNAYHASPDLSGAGNIAWDARKYQMFLRQLGSLEEKLYVAVAADGVFSEIQHGFPPEVHDPLWT
jgi:hypothetical protein